MLCLLLSYILNTIRPLWSDIGNAAVRIDRRDNRCIDWWHTVYKLNIFDQSIQVTDSSPDDVGSSHEHSESISTSGYEFIAGHGVERIVRQDGRAIGKCQPNDP